MVGSSVNGAGDTDGDARGNSGSAFVVDPNCCPADFNGDCVADTRGVLAFLNAWTAGGGLADCDGNGVINTRDAVCFLNIWAPGR